VSNSSRTREPKLSTYGFCHGALGSIYALPALENRHQSLVGVDASVTLDRECLAGELVDDVQQLQDPPVGGLIKLEVQRPHVIGVLGAQPLGPDGRGPEPLALASPLRHPQALLVPQPLRALAVQRPALIQQPLMRTAIPPPRTIARDLPQLRAQRRIVASDQWRVALRGAVLTGISARPPLGEAKTILKHSDRLAPTRRAHQFPGMRMPVSSWHLVRGLRSRDRDMGLVGDHTQRAGRAFKG
jgi:hypothetical protein